MPIYEQTATADGTQVYLAARPHAAMVGLELVLDGGARRDPPARSGTSQIVDMLLPEGTAGTGRAELIARFADLGAALYVSAMYNCLLIGTRVLSSFAASALELLCDVARYPTLPEAALAEERRGMTRMDPRHASVDTLAMLAAVAEVTGLPPSQGMGVLTRDAIRELTAEDARVFIEAAIARRPRALLVAGGVDLDTASTWIGNAIAGLPALGSDTGSMEVTQTPRTDRRAVVLVDRPGDEAVIALAMPAADVDAADEITREIASIVVSGSLNADLREGHGMTYGVRETIWPTRAGQVYEFSLRLHPQDVGRALERIRIVLRSLQSITPSTAWVERVQTRWLVRQMDAFQTTSGMLWGARSIHVHGRPIDHHRRKVRELHAVAGLEVSRALRRHFDLRSIQIAVVGPAATLRPDVEKAVPDPVRVIDPSSLT